jgi:hypothetical protein
MLAASMVLTGNRDGVCGAAAAAVCELIGLMTCLPPNGLRIEAVLNQVG